jgi:5-methylcytosine-specific restriction endonuclease McrA
VTCGRRMGRTRLYTDEERKERAISRAKQWRLDNPERARELERKSHSRPDAIKRKKEWAREHRCKKREEYNRKQREYRRTSVGNAVIRNCLHTRRAQIRDTATESLTELYRKIHENIVWCHICWKRIDGATCHIDHIVPLSKGGTHTRDNIAPACPECNLRKSASLG